MGRIAVALACLASLLALASPAGAAAPRLSELVVYPNGSARQVSVTAGAVTVSVRGKHCAVPAGTALAALIAARPGALSLHDYGSCSARPADAAGLFVAAIGHYRNRRQNGWVYKVGRRSATAGAADPSGPFGRGTLAAGAQLTWFYCHMNARARSCQPTLAVSTRALGGGSLRVRVRAYDDRGRVHVPARATVHASSTSASTDAQGIATLHLTPGTASVYATAGGAVRSFATEVGVS